MVSCSVWQWCLVILSVGRSVQCRTLPNVASTGRFDHDSVQRKELEPQGLKRQTSSEWRKTGGTRLEAGGVCFRFWQHGGQRQEFPVGTRTESKVPFLPPRPSSLGSGRNAAKVCAEVCPFCRKGLRSPAATCDQTCFHVKILPPEITAPLFVLLCDVPLTVCIAAILKILSGRKDLQKSQKHIDVKLRFPYATRRRSTALLLEQMP